MSEKEKSWPCSIRRDISRSAIQKGNAAGLFGLQDFTEQSQNQYLQSRLFYQTVRVYFRITNNNTMQFNRVNNIVGWDRGIVCLYSLCHDHGSHRQLLGLR